MQVEFAEIESAMAFCEKNGKNFMLDISRIIQSVIVLRQGL